MRAKRLSLAVFCLMIAAGAAPAHADLVHFASGRSMSVKGVRVDGTSLVLSLRGGGEMTCDRTAIVRIEPDEVPYPEETNAPHAIDAQAPVPIDELRAAIDPIIERASAEHGVSADLVRAMVQVESAYQPRARSPKGALGLMQLMPATARQYAVADPFDPESNIEAGIRHLKSLLDRLPTALALAAYNAGEATVRRFRGMPPYAETRTYVSRVLALLKKPS